jgi:hypothetical protein
MLALRTFKSLLDWEGEYMIYTKKLLQSYHEQSEEGKKATCLHFSGVGNQDVYNITAPFELAGKEVIAGRIEARESENSTVGLFEQVEDNIWSKITEGIDLPLQDPFYTRIDGQVILGGVEVVFLDHGKANWRTVFYHLLNLSEAKKLFVGPWGMKDLRLKQLPSGEILVLTRPQGEKGGRGKIGATIIKCLADLSIETIEEAPLLTNQFTEDEWGGGNEIHLVNDEVWVLGHIANFDDQGNRHYYAFVFCLDQKNLAMTKAKIIAERRDFENAPSKRPDLEDVVFSGGLQIAEKHVVLYAGISDAGAQKIELENPFR